MIQRRSLKSTVEPLGPSEPIREQEDDEEDHIDKMVPPKVMRLTQHYHNLIYIRYFWESIGQQPPDWIKGEMERADHVLRKELEREEGQGGALHRWRDRHETRKS
jgi:hypothetical protein